MTLNKNLDKDLLLGEARKLYLKPVAEIMELLRYKTPKIWEYSFGNSQIGMDFSIKITESEFHLRRTFGDDSSQDLIYGGKAYSKPIIISDELPEIAYILSRGVFLTDISREAEKLKAREREFAGIVRAYTESICKNSLIEKLNEWQKKFGYHETAELWKDFTGDHKQLEWAIDNDIDCLDYDRWQFVQKLLKHELKYETASEIFKTLYEKEDIDIFDCE